LEGAPLREAEFFAHELTKRRFPFGAMVLNRVLPDFLTSPDGQASAAAIADHADGLAKGLASLDEARLDDPEAVARVLRTMAATFRDYSVVATRERELRGELGRVPDVVASVPAFPDDVHDLAGLARIGRALLANP